MTQPVTPFDGAIVHPETDLLDAESAKGCGSGTTSTNAAYCEPLPPPTSDTSVRQNCAFDAVRHCNMRPLSEAPTMFLRKEDAVVSAPVAHPHFATGGLCRLSPQGDSAGGMLAESVALTNPLFSNPLFVEGGGLQDGCFSKLPADASGDAILSKIFSCLLDEDYPNSGTPLCSFLASTLSFTSFGSVGEVLAR
jgi:hypothetical protein